MMILDDSEVCRECAAFSAGNGYCASLPAHPFEPVSIEEYVALHPEDRVAGAYLKSREAEVAHWRKRLEEGATLEQVEREVAAGGGLNVHAVTATAATAATAAAPDWKRVLGEPGSVRRVARPDADVDVDVELLERGGGLSFDDVYITPLLDWTMESRNVGRHDGHMANLVVTRNETGLPWVDGWSEGDEALDRLLSAAMNELDRNSPPPPRAGAAAAACNTSNLDPCSE